MLKKYPFIKQQGLKDCAVCSIWMIVRYYQGNIIFSELKEMLKIGRSGTNAYQMIKVLEKIGFEAKGIRENVLKNTKVPFIAHTIINNTYKHFVVVYEINKKYVIVADPATKIKKISHKDFLKIWSGINIVMHPIKPLPKEKEISLLKFAFKFIKPFKFMILKLGLLSLVVTLCSVLNAFFFQSLIDNMQLFKATSIIFIMIMFIHSLLSFFRNKILVGLAKNIEKSLFENVFKQIINLPYPYYSNHTTGEVLSKINDLEFLKETIINVLINLFAMFPVFVFSGILLADISLKLFIIQICCLLFYVLIIILFHKNILFLIGDFQSNKAGVSSYMNECITGYRTIKGLNIGNQVFSVFDNKYSKYLGSNYNLNMVSNRQEFLKSLVYVFGQAFTLIYGIYLVKNDSMTLGTLITYISLTTLFLEPVKAFVDLDVSLKQSSMALRRVLEIILHSKEKVKESFNGNIVFSNVSFSFDNLNYVLKNVSFTIKQANKVLISGKSGSGKSTLFKLLKGYYRYKGDILINNRRSNSDRILLVNASEFIFTETIYNNLTIRSNKDMKNIIKICNVDNILNAFDLKGYTLLEENGFNLSSGQRQQIALSRALSDFDVLLIDEGFSNLSSDLERQILKKLFKYFKEKTIVLISHRLDNLDLFDQYIKLSNGKVVLDEVRAEGVNDV